MADKVAERKLTTILAIDVVGFSRLMADDEAGTLARVKANIEQIIEPGARRHGGRIVKLIGDGVLMDFGSVVGAVRFAIEAQDAFSQRDAGRPAASRIVYRMGINTGDVLVDGDDIYGDGVNVAARLEALAEPGGICVSQSVHDHVRGKLSVAFEDLGPRDLKNIPEPVRLYRVVAGTPGTAAPRRRRRYALIASIAAAVLLFAIAGAAFWWQPWLQAEPTAKVADMAFPLPAKPSIAVLPFTNLSSERGRGVLADGLTHDLITDLSRISGLFVIASNSSSAFRDNDNAVKSAAEALAVRFVLRGSVREADTTLRINVQLIDATTGQFVWADRFDTDADHVLAVHGRIALGIVSALGLNLSEKEQTGIDAAGTDRLDAWHAFQRGWELYSRFNSLDNARSVRHFREAVELDPEYGRAYGALALVHLRGSIFGWEKPLGEPRAKLYREIVPHYLQQAERHGTALVHVVRAMQHLFYRHGARPEGANRGTDDARREAAAAIARQPNDPEAHVTMAWALITAGKPREGLDFIRTAERLNPVHPRHYDFFHAAAYVALDDLDQAARILQAGLSREPDATALLPLAASVFAHLGRRDEAAAAIRAWLPGATAEEIDKTIAHFEFPIRWINDQTWRNFYLLDGLRIAALRKDTTLAGLLDRLGTQRSGDMRATIRMIGWFGPAAADAVRPLVGALAIDDTLVRKEAIIALGKIGPAADAAVEPLARFVDRPILGYHARRAIARILGR